MGVQTMCYVCLSMLLRDNERQNECDLGQNTISEIFQDISFPQIAIAIVLFGFFSIIASYDMEKSANSIV